MEYDELKSKVVKRKKEFDKFIDFLENKTSWLTTPASRKHHLNEEGGLLKHSLNVTNTLLKIRPVLAPEIAEESCIIVGLFHDVGKIGSQREPRYIERDGEYVKNKNLVEMHIAARSLYLISQYITLSDEEAQAILYHDGQYIPENKFIAHKECPLTLMIQYADSWAAFVLENKSFI